MKNMTLRNIADACGGTYVGNEAAKDMEIAGAVIDSRLVEKDYLFIPIRGERVDGHRFIPDVFEKGALAVLSEEKLSDPAGPYILVESCEDAMKKLAAFYRRALDIKVVGITGSVGKTSTKEMIASVLEQKYNVLKTEGNFNNEIGLPLTIFKIKSMHQIAVLEMGISDFGEMHRLAEMAYPDICVITNIGLCHLENLITRDGILKAKTESFEHLTAEGSAVLNGDDDKLSTKKMVNGRPALFYGLEKEGTTIEAEGRIEKLAQKSIFATDVEAVGLTGTKAVIHITREAVAENVPKGSAEWMVWEKELADGDEVSFAAEIPIAGEHNVYNALAATAVGLKLGLSMEEIRRGIENVQTIGGRSNLIHHEGITIIDDCYNANPVSMKASIDVLSKADGRKIAVLGDMGELGTEERQLHYSIGEYFHGKGIDELFCTGELSGEIAKAAKICSKETDVHYFQDKEMMIEELKKEIRPGDTILVKASHFMQFPEIVKKLQA